ncbi:hypothetical protein O6H91_17G069100 [Diphasiastrum complanatum]|uniref:Uncharacterized protein n=1 Tax=Diphasiastrum complanatum TaxID=34168 RepID=A0ACC2B805_DIPCM|nr:hypothetical protein O6H91_17G069100 [Diphasiastrum complanatum]
MRTRQLVEVGRKPKFSAATLQKINLFLYLLTDPKGKTQGDLKQKSNNLLLTVNYCDWSNCGVYLLTTDCCHWQRISSWKTSSCCLSGIQSSADKCWQESRGKRYRYIPVLILGCI